MARMTHRARVPEHLWPAEAAFDDAAQKWVTLVDGQRRSSDTLRGIYSVIGAAKMQGHKVERPGSKGLR